MDMKYNRRGLQMRQQSLAAGDFEKYRKKARKEAFLVEMDQIIPWRELSAVIEPF
jgi:IS5 family transposase